MLITDNDWCWGRGNQCTLTFSFDVFLPVHIPDQVLFQAGLIPTGRLTSGSNAAPRLD